LQTAGNGTPKRESGEVGFTWDRAIGLQGKGKGKSGERPQSGENGSRGKGAVAGSRCSVRRPRWRTAERRKGPTKARKQGINGLSKEEE